MRQIAGIALLGLSGIAAAIGSTPTWTATGAAAGATFGASVAVGDVNGDGITDLIVGAIEPDPSGGMWPPPFSASTGRVFVYFGHGGGLGASPDCVLEGEAVGDQFGAAVSTGDVNGDKIADIIVGAPRAAGGHGRVYVFHGQSSGPSASANWIAEGELDANEGGGNFGASVSTAGDVNGDKKDDVVVGAPGWWGGWYSTGGAAYVYVTSAAGLPATATWTVKVDDLVNADGYAPDNVGASVACAGDVNKDGYADILVGAPDYNWIPGIGEMPGAFLFTGGPGGLVTTPAWVGISGVTGTTPGYGICVAPAGDLNHDGYSDFIVGASYLDSYTGRAYVYHGKAAALDTIAAAAIIGGPDGDYQFGVSACGIGDVDKDGNAEIAIASGNGNVHIYEYSTGGWGLAADFTDAGTVVAVADLNKGGTPELIVGDPWHDQTEPTPAYQVGRVSVFGAGDDGTTELPVDPPVIPGAEDGSGSKSGLHCSAVGGSGGLALLLAVLLATGRRSSR